MDEVVSPPGDHKNDPPVIDGFAVNKVLEPEQTVGLFTATVADEFTTIVFVVVLQPLALQA
jgi:hypothetical protein